MSKTFVDIVGRDLTSGAFDSADKGLGTLKGSVNALRNSLGALGLGFSAVASISKVISSASQFENSLVGVAKTTGLTGAALESFAERIDSLSKTIPVTTEELLTLAQAAGQMGVAGADNLEKFSVTVAKLGRASDLAGEEAAKSLARILNVTGESVDSVDTLASVFVSLGNNVAASESEIARITTEVARAAGVFGVTSAEAAAMGAAMSAVGIRAELGGSSVGRAMQEITSRVQTGGASLREFATVLELNEETLVSLFAENKTKAFEFFLKNVGELGLGAGNALKEVNLSGQEIAKTIIPLAGNLDILAQTLSLANAEVAEATALNDEFEASLTTLSSEWQKTKNIMESFARSIGETLIPTLNSGLDALNSFFAGVSQGTEIEQQINLISSLEEELRHLSGLSGVFGVFGPTKKDFDLLEFRLENARLDLQDMTKAAEQSSVAIKELSGDLASGGGSTPSSNDSPVKKAVSEAERFIKSLRIQAAETGKTGSELQRYRAEVLGVSKAAEPMIVRIEETNQALKEQQEEAKRATKDLASIKSVTESVATAEERFAARQSELNRLLGVEGGLSVETYNRALAKLRGELFKVEDVAKRVFDNTEQIGIQSVRGIQTEFAKFLSGTEANFGKMLKNISAQASSFVILGGLESLLTGNGNSTQDNGFRDIFGSLLDVNKSSKKTTEQIAASSEVTAAWLGTIAKESRFSLSGATDRLSGAAQSAFSNANPIAGALTVTAGSLAGARGNATALAGAAATFGGPVGIAAAAGILVTSVLDKKFGDFKLPDGVETTLETLKGIATLGGSFVGDKTLAALGINIPDPATLILKALFGRGPLKQRRTTLTGEVDSEGLDEATLATFFKASGGAFRSSKRDFTTVDLAGNTNTDNEDLEGFVKDLSRFARQLFGAIDDSVKETSEALRDMGGNLNLSTAGIESFGREIDLISEKGELLTDEQISNEIQLITEELSRGLLPAVDDLSKTGETAFQSIQRLNSEFDVLSDIMLLLGRDTGQARAELLGLSFDVRSELVGRLGGVQEANTAFDSFFSNFLSPEDQLEIFTDKLLVELKKFDINRVVSPSEVAEAFLSGGLSTGLIIGALTPAMQELILNVDRLKNSVQGASGGIDNSLSNTFSDLEKSVNTERNRLATEYNEAVKDTNDSINTLTTLANSLKTATDTINPLGLTSARNSIRGAIAEATSGNIVELSSVRNALVKLSDNDTGAFSSRVDFQRSQAENTTLLNELGELTDNQLSTEEKSLESLKQGFDDEVIRLDSIITEAQKQSGSLERIELSLADAITSFNVSSFNAGGAGGIAGGSSVSQDDIRSFFSTARTDQEIIAAQRATGTSSDEILSAVTRFTERDREEFFARNPNIARFHRGGSPSAEGLAFIHPSERVLTSDQNKDLIKVLNELLTEFKKVGVNTKQAAKILDDVTQGGDRVLTEAA